MDDVFIVRVRGGGLWWPGAGGLGLRGEGTPTAGLRYIRRRGSVWRSLNGRNGLVFEAGRLVVFVEIGLQSEGFITSLAVEVLESRMGLHVSTEIGPDQRRI